jgi:hypothetical protein
MNTTEAIQQLLTIVESLRNTYKTKNKKFTLDGRLVGDIGEVIVQDNYDVELFDKVVPKYDGIDSLKRKIQIKATFHNTLGFPCFKNDVPDYYIGILLKNDGTFEEVYNGAGISIWESIKNRKETTNKLHNISISTLKKLNIEVLDKDRIPRRK